MPALSLDSLNDRPELVQLNVITYTTGVQLDPYRDLQNQILCIHFDGHSSLGASLELRTVAPVL